MLTRAGIATTELPPAIDSPCAWYGPDIVGRTEWIEHLSADDLDEIECAAERLATTDPDWSAMDRDQFPLSRLAERLHYVLNDVLEGRGFALLRRLPVEPWGQRLSAIALLGLGLHWGRLRSQNRHGHLLGHVKDMGLASHDPSVRIYQTKERQNYHTDSCDIVGLLCLHPAKFGGQSSLVSSVTLFNEMRKRRPDLARVLFEPIETDRRGEVAPGQRPFFCIPVFNWYAGLLTTIYHRNYIDSARRFPEVAPLRPEQIQALDLFDQLANDPALHFSMDLQMGDIQLVHNHTLLHDRTAFEDWPESHRKRHLLRLWLAPEKARPLPPVFAERYGSIVPGERGGITVPEMRYTVPWEAIGPA
jgi:Taurine catabolism dioxygenase TauD, TfdA family